MHKYRIVHNIMMKKIILFSLFLLIFNLTQAQDDDLAKAEKYLSYQKYEYALKYYLKYYPKDSLSFDLNFKIGDLYLLTDIDKSKAMIYLLRAKILTEKPNPDLLFSLAKAYYYDYSFEKAISYLSEYSIQAKDIETKKRAGSFLQTILSAETLFADSVEAEIVYLGDSINSTRSDINPFINNYENRIFFSSRREKNAYHIFYSEYDSINNYWKKPQKMESISSNYEDIIAGVDRFENEIFIHFADDSPILDLFSSKKANSNYAEPMMAGKLISSVQKAEGATLSASGDTLYFASNLVMGFGGFDLYYSIKLPDGEWGIPINLGEKVNSEMDENYPFISNDGQKLYFSSTGFNSMGGYDLFVSEKESNGEWAFPVNLGFPVNDVYDNKTISLPENNRYAYTSYVKPFSGLGSNDLYKIIFKQRDPQFLTYIANIYFGDKNYKKPVNLVSTDFAINLYEKKTNELVGTYALNKKSSKIVLALMPGDYVLTIENHFFETLKQNITVNEQTYKKDIIFTEYLLKQK